MDRENEKIIEDIEENMKKGVLEMLVLKALCGKDLYGYEMADYVNAQSDGKIRIKEGSLYGPIYRLIDRGCISETKVLVGKRRTRIYFHIEQQGIDYLKTLTEVYRRVNEGVNQFLNGGDRNDAL